MNQPIHWFKFEPAWWVMKITQLHLSPAAQGMLLQLVCLQWEEGNVPASIDQLKRQLNNPTGEGIEEALALFLTVSGQMSRKYWPVVEAWREDSIKKHRERSNSGKKGYEAKMAKAKHKYEDEQTKEMRK